LRGLCVNINMKPLSQILIFLLVFLSPVNAQQSISTYFGFHTEVVRAHATTPLCSNVTPLPNESFNQTIEELFGPNNEIGLKAGNIQTGDPDIVWVENRDERVPIHYDNGWRSVEFEGENMSGFIAKDSNFSIESHKDLDWYIGFLGYVSQKAMVYDVHAGYNTLNRGFPVPIRLDKSGIATSAGFKWGDELTGDIVYIFNNDGAFDGYYYSGKGWKKLGDEGYFGAVYLSSSLAIDVRGKGGRIIISPPAPVRQSKLAPKVYGRWPSVVEPPPRPDVYTSIQISGGVPYFVASWNPHNFKVVYTTEIYDPTMQPNWFSVGWQISPEGLENPPPLATVASLHSLRYGLGRVIAEWSNPPTKRLK